MGEPPPPPWSFEQAFVFSDGPLTGQGGWTGASSLTIVSNTLRRTTAGQGWNDHPISAEDLGSGFYMQVSHQWANHADNQTVELSMFDADDNLVALLDVRFEGGTFSFEVDGPSDFISGTPTAPNKTDPHLVSLQVSAAGDVELTYDGMVIGTGTLDFAGALPTYCEVWMAATANTTACRVFSVSMGRV